MNEVRKSVTSQVLIEAKILEVTLDDQYSAGIDWSNLNFLSGKAGANFTGAGGFGAAPRANIPISSLSGATDAALNVAYVGNHLTAFVDAIQGFGVVKALASPRLTVLNNQAAVMNVATNQVFFEIDIDRQEATADTPASVEIDSTIRNVPEGVLVNVIPSIDLENQTVSLSLRPTITRIVNEIQDPAVAFVAPEIDSLVPELNVQEIDSVIQVRSGQAIVLGGLLQDRTESTTEAVPVVGEVPYLGNLFKKKSDAIQKTELVILLKATIVENYNNIHGFNDYNAKYNRDVVIDIDRQIVLETVTGPIFLDKKKEIIAPCNLATISENTTLDTFTGELLSPKSDTSDQSNESDWSVVMDDSN